MSFFMLKKGGIYQWTDVLCSGLQFKVLNIHERQNGLRFNRVYVLRYLNYKYKPAPVVVEITHSFILRKSHLIALVAEPELFDGISNPPSKEVRKTIQGVN